VKGFKRQGDRAFFFRDVARAMSVIGLIAQLIADITVVFDTQTAGVGHWAYTETLLPSVPGKLWIEIELTKAGERTSTELIPTFVHPSSPQ